MVDNNKSVLSRSSDIDMLVRGLHNMAKAERQQSDTLVELGREVSEAGSSHRSPPRIMFEALGEEGMRTAYHCKAAALEALGGLISGKLVITEDTYNRLSQKAWDNEINHPLSSLTPIKNNCKDPVKYDAAIEKLHGNFNSITSTLWQDAVRFADRRGGLERQ